VKLTSVELGSEKKSQIKLDDVA